MKPSTLTRTSPIQTLLGLGLAACLSFSLLGADASEAQPTTSERLTIQSKIDHHVFLNEAIFPWAHNAYNSDSSEPGYGYIFPNQSETITTMLDAGLRLIDLDLVWANFEVRMCHGGLGACAGGEVTFETRLKEIKDWFDADLSRYETEVVILHVESKIQDNNFPWADMSDFSGCHYHIAVDDIRDSGIDDLVYKPNSTCTDFADLAASITKADVLSAGKNIIFIGADDASCGHQCMEVFGETDKWGHWVFNKLPDGNLIDHESFSGFPNCSGGGFAGHDAFTVAYNDIVGALHTNYMTGPEMERLVGCGVNGISHEKFVEDNSYHKAHVWSWGIDEPRGLFDDRDCALLSNDDGMADAKCTMGNHRFVCQNLETGGMVKTTHQRDWIEGQQSCYENFGLDYVFSVPANGYQSNLITSTLANPSTVWVNYSDSMSEGDWKPMAAATETVFDLEAENADGKLRRTTTIPMSSDAAPATDRFGTHGGALEFSQSHDTLVEGLLEQEFGAHATMSIWFKGNAGAQMPYDSRLAVFSETGWSHNTGILIKPDGTLYARCHDETDTRRGQTSSNDLVAGYSGPTQFWDGQWHHAAYVTDGSTSKLYIDGELMSSTNDSCADLVDSVFITIGSSLQYRHHAFDGVLDDLRIYGAALSAEDIHKLFFDRGLYSHQLGQIHSGPISGGQSVKDGALIRADLHDGIQHGWVDYYATSSTRKSYQYTAGLAHAINDQASDLLAVAGEWRSDDTLDVLSSNYRNYIWGISSNAWVQITRHDPVNLYTLSGPTLSQGDVIDLTVSGPGGTWEYSYTVPSSYYGARWRWPAQLASVINAKASEGYPARGGEYNSDGSIGTIGSGHRNKVWVGTHNAGLWQVTMKINGVVQ